MYKIKPYKMCSGNPQSTGNKWWIVLLFGMRNLKQGP